MKKPRLVYSDALARHLWAHCKDPSVSAVCSRALRGVMQDRAEVLRRYTALVKANELSPLPPQLGGGA